MKSNRKFIANIWILYIFVTFALFIYELLFGASEYFLLSLFIGLPFVMGLTFAIKTGYSLIILFSSVALISGWLSPLGFFFQRDSYTYSGFAAVKDFHFTVFEFISFYLPIIFCYFTTLFTAVIMSKKNKSSLKYVNVSGRYATSLNDNIFLSSWLLRKLFLAIIIIFGLINYWMFNNSIGITGVNPPVLPLKISGFLYYLSRFIFPVILIFLLKRIPVSAFDLVMLMFYACFAAFTTVSKTTLFLIMVPVLIHSYFNKRYFIGFIAISLLIIIYSAISLARNYVYLNDAGVSIRNIDFSMFDVLLKTVESYSTKDLLAAPLSILDRIGGGQDVALAAQYDNLHIAGPLIEFVRVYIYDFFDLNTQAQGYMYDYTPDILGFATGDGGFFAHMLLVGGTSLPMLTFVGIYQGILLAAGNATYLRLQKLKIAREICLFYAILFCILFYLLSNSLWLNTFLILTFCVVRTRIFISFIKKFRLQEFTVNI